MALPACFGDDAESAATRQSALVTNPALVISQVYGSGGNTGALFRNDFVEIFNRSSSSVTLDGLSLQYASAAGTGNLGASASQLVALPAGVSLAPGAYFLVQLAGGTIGAALPAADATGTINMSGTAGKVALVTGVDTLGCNGGSTPCTQAQSDRIIDLVGFGAANFFEGSGPTSAPSATLAVFRAAGGCTDTNNNAADFAGAAPAPRNTASPQAVCAGATELAPSVTGTVPAAGAVNVSAASPLSVTFSEPVVVAGAWFDITCSLSGAHAATASAGPSTYTLTPTTPFSAGEQCSVTVHAASVTDVDSVDPPDAMATDYVFAFTVAQPLTGTPVHTIQGASHRSPFVGQTVSVGPAIVTAKKSNGFYMEDPTPDNDDATSEGIFVFTSTAPTVAVGDRVVVTANVAEFRPGCASCTASDSAFDNLTTTELTTIGRIDVQATGQALPTPVLLGTGPGARSVPTQVIEDDVAGDVETGGVFDPATDGIDFYESLEAMRVRIDSPSVVGPTAVFTSGDREIAVLARSDAGLRTPRGGIIIAPTDYNPERVFLSNGLGQTLPVANVGDAFNGPVVGVFDYSFANFKLFVSEPLPPVVPGGLSPEVTSLTTQLSTQLTVGSINVENLDPADGAAKFARLAAIVVQNLGAPDIVALEEVQDNNGATSDGTVDASVTLSTFVNAIQAAGGPLYQYAQINPVNNQDGGEPGGNIRVVILYRTDRGVQFVARGAATSTSANAVDTSSGAPHLALSPGRIDPNNAAFSSSRKPLAAELTFGGRTFFVIANHWNSKGGDDALFGRFQPPVLNSEVQRRAQAEVVAGFIDTLLLADSQAAVVVLGDLNDFSFSAPVTRLKAEGMVDLIETLPAGERYTYVFQGNAQDLDHILVSPTLASRTSYDVVHVNAEFSDQASDHEPSVARIELGNPPVISVPRPPDPIALGKTFSFRVSATATPPATFALTSAPAGMTIDPSTGIVTWTPTATGVYAFTVRAQNGVGTTTQTFEVTVVTAVSVPASPGSVLLALALGLLALGARRMRRRA